MNVVQPLDCDRHGAIYTKEIDDDNKLLITFYVNHGLVAATKKELADSFLKELSERLQITTKPASYYLGLQIVRQKDGSLFINQVAYAKKVLERFGMAECNPVTTPIEKESSLSGKAYTDKVEKFPYREAVGALAYLTIGIRPDILVSL